MFNIPVVDIMLTTGCNLGCKYCFERGVDVRNLDKEKFMEYVNRKTNTDFFIFGGEPLIRKDILEDLFKVIAVRGSSHNLITNGTLIDDEFADLMAKYHIHAQLSVDGPKHVHDMKRVYKGGGGTFDKIMEVITLLERHKVGWSMHGVITKDTLPYISDTLSFYVSMLINHNRANEIPKMLGSNNFQIIFEEDYTDDDIITVISEFKIFFDWFKKTNIPKDIKEASYKSILSRQTARCGAGNGLFAIDTDFGVYPCHRLATAPDREKYRIGDVYSPEKFTDYKLHKHFYRAKAFHCYSTFLNTPNKGIGWQKSCPATNIETTGNIYYQNPKYNLMMNELKRVIDDNTRIWQQNNGK